MEWELPGQGWAVAISLDGLTLGNGYVPDAYKGSRSLLGAVGPAAGRSQYGLLRASNLIHDRDRVYSADFATRIAGLGIESIRTPELTYRTSELGCCQNCCQADGCVTTWHKMS